MNLAAERVKIFFETLTRERVQALHEVYAAHASFKDPFNEVQGLPAIRRIFEHMFEQVDTPRFIVHDMAADAQQAFLTWDFIFQRKADGSEMTIRGATHIRFAPDGRIEIHRDYWDAAEELYEKIAGLGALMRWLKRRLAAR